MNNIRTAYLLTTDPLSEKAIFSKNILETIGFEVNFFLALKAITPLLSNRKSLYSIYSIIANGDDQWCYVFEDDINVLEEIKLDEIIEYENISDKFFYLGLCKYRDQEGITSSGRFIKNKEIFTVSNYVRGKHAIGLSKQGASDILQLFNIPNEDFIYVDVILEYYLSLHPTNVVRYDLESYNSGHRGIIFQDRNKFESTVTNNINNPISNPIPTSNPIITFATAIYSFKSKYTTIKYIQWMKNLFSIVNHFYLVVFTDEVLYAIVNNQAKNNSKIHVVLCPIENFSLYQYKDFWIQNHEKNYYLNQLIGWELNMLYNEKIQLLSDTIEKQYFPTTAYYGWIDIGYFRNEFNNIHTNSLQNWAISQKVNSFNESYIHYTLKEPQNLKDSINFRHTNKTNPLQIEYSVAGGFFFGGKQVVQKWREMFYSKLKWYISMNWIVKDDQMIINDCLSDITWISQSQDTSEILINNCCTADQNNSDNKCLFKLYYDATHDYIFNNWFLFQKLLNYK